MKLAAWISAQNMTRTAFAARIGVSPSFITLLCNDDSWPGRRVAKAIFRETDGAVTAHDFMTEPPDAGHLDASPCPCV
jgi:3,4-dihydroxy 2-butanone 4-phosphate synthase/GTP cyclohydrolase II